MAMNSRVSNPWSWLIVGILVVVAAVALVAVLSVSSSVGYGMMGDGWGGGTGWGWGVAMMIVPLVLLVMLVLLLVAALAPRAGAYSPLPPTSLDASPTALSILNARYARNEISREEYVRVRTDLESPRL
jgi:putative membrane protein